MKRAVLKKLIKETIKNLSLRESVDLERLEHGISQATITGKHWIGMVKNLESLIADSSQFNSLYLTQKANINQKDVVDKLTQVVKLLEQIQPEFQKMSQHERDDQL